MNAVDKLDPAAQMRERLAGLEPQLIEIYDESLEHIGHEGANGGGHYQLLIVSAHFERQSRLARHRLIYAAVGEMLGSVVHALAISAYTQEEWNRAFPGE